MAAPHLLLPAATSAELRATTFEGQLHNEFRVPARTTVSKIKGSEQALTLGSGSAQISVRTFRGRVVIRSR